MKRAVIVTVTVVLTTLLFMLPVITVIAIGNEYTSPLQCMGRNPKDGTIVVANRFPFDVTPVDVQELLEVEFTEIAPSELTEASVTFIAWMILSNEETGMTYVAMYYDGVADVVYAVISSNMTERRNRELTNGIPQPDCGVWSTDASTIDEWMRRVTGRISAQQT